MRGKEKQVSEDEEPSSYKDEDLGINESLLNACEIEQYKFQTRMQDIEFEYNYKLFMKMFAGKTGIMGENFWTSVLEANSNNFVEFDDAWNLMNELAIESSLVFLSYNIAFHKKAMYEVLKVKADQAQMQGKPRSDDQMIEDTMMMLAEATSCRNCAKLDVEILALYQSGLDNYNDIIGNSNSFLDQITDQK